MSRLLHSSKFWTAVVAAVFNIISFVAATYYPAYKELVIVVITGLDGVFAVVIAATAYEDGQEKRGAAAAESWRLQEQADCPPVNEDGK